jgi:hypothetical protein
MLPDARRDDGGVIDLDDVGGVERAPPAGFGGAIVVVVSGW